MVSGAFVATAVDRHCEDVGVARHELQDAPVVVEDPGMTTVQRDTTRRVDGRDLTGRRRRVLGHGFAHSWPTSLAYSPRSATSCSWVPRSVILPCLSTMISSQS